MRSRFDEQLVVLNTDLIEMGAMCEEVIALAAKALIEQNKLNFTEISIKTGFSTTRTFNRAFLRSEGITPMQYKKSTGRH